MKRKAALNLVAGLQTGLPTFDTLCSTKEQDKLVTGAKAECVKEGVTNIGRADQKEGLGLGSGSGLKEAQPLSC